MTAFVAVTALVAIPLLWVVLHDARVNARRIEQGRKRADDSNPTTRSAA